jgi:DNA-dependent protein kinase catalytic subunit
MLFYYRQAFSRVSSSPELGIGDRHLSNMLVSQRTGTALGIDFGHAFGSATQMLPVPELIPFRLTEYMLALMGPLRHSGKYTLLNIYS